MVRKRKKAQTAFPDEVVQELGPSSFITKRGYVIEGNYRIGDKILMIYDRGSLRFMPMYVRKRDAVPTEEKIVGKGTRPLGRVRNTTPVMAQFNKADKKIYFQVKSETDKSFYIDLSLADKCKEPLAFGVIEYAPYYGVLIYKTGPDTLPCPVSVRALRFKVKSQKTGNKVTVSGEEYEERLFDYQFTEINSDPPATPQISDVRMFDLGFKGSHIYASEGGFSIDCGWLCSVTWEPASGYSEPTIWDYDGTVHGEVSYGCQNWGGGPFIEYARYAYHVRTWGTRRLENLNSIYNSGVELIGLAVWLEGGAEASHIRWRAYGKITYNYQYDVWVDSHRHAWDDGAYCHTDTQQDDSENMGGIDINLPFGLVLHDSGTYALDDIFGWVTAKVYVDWWYGYQIGPPYLFRWGFPSLGNEVVTEYVPGYFIMSKFDTSGEIADAFPIWSTRTTFSWLVTFEKARAESISGNLYSHWPCLSFPGKGVKEEKDFTWNTPPYVGGGTSHHQGGGKTSRAMCRFLPFNFVVYPDASSPHFNKSAYWLNGVYKADGVPVSPLTNWGKVAKELLLASEVYGMAQPSAVDSVSTSDSYSGVKHIISNVTGKHTTANDLTGTNWKTEAYDPYQLPAYYFKFGWRNLADFGILPRGWAS